MHANKSQPIQSKPDYLAKLSERLLSDLAALDADGEEITAVTRVEIERIEDVTDIVKTYLIGQGVPDELLLADQLPMPSEMEESVSEFESEGGVPQLAFLPPLEKQDIHLLLEGVNYEDRIRMGPPHAPLLEEDTESVESIQRVPVPPPPPPPPKEVEVLADCDLHRTEDKSINEVYIAVPLWVSGITLILRIERRPARKREKPLPPPVEPGPAAYDFEREGQRFKDITRLAGMVRRVSSEEEEAEPPPKKLPPSITVSLPLSPQPTTPLKHQVDEAEEIKIVLEEDHLLGMREEEAEGGLYDMELAGQRLEGSSRLRRGPKLYDESSLDQWEAGRGGPTQVTLIKKESHGRFELVIETPLIGVPEQHRCKEVPDQRYEHLEFIRTIEKDTTHPTSLASPDHVLRTRREYKLVFTCREFGDVQEHCAVMLESRGIVGEHTGKKWIEPVTGGLLPAGG